MTAITREEREATLIAVAPAKLNLGLRVTGRRPDGYHLLESIFVPLDLEDRLEIEVSTGSAEGPSVDFALDEGSDVDGVPRDASNLAARAAIAFLEESGTAARVRIRLCKRIPSGAGLGGGSSDAAAVLRGLSALLPGTVPSGELCRLALRLGADVPYFLAPQPALVRGVGERIEPLRDLPRLVFALANPRIFLSTAEVYAAFDALGASLTGQEPRPTLRALLGPQAGSEGFGVRLQTLLANDLEPAVRRLCPPVARLRERLGAVGALATGMTGSGATVFGVFPDADRARAALAEAEFGPPVWARVVRSVAHKRG